MLVLRAFYWTIDLGKLVTWTKLEFSICLNTSAICVVDFTYDKSYISIWCAYNNVDMDIRSPALSVKDSLKSNRKPTQSPWG